MKYKVIQKEAFQMSGIKKQVSCKNGENFIAIPKIWEEANHDGIVGKLAENNTGELKGILGICSNFCEQTQSMDYWIASASTEEGKENLFECIQVPTSTWAVFEVHGALPDAMQKVWKQIYAEWFPSSNYKHAGTMEFELYPEGNPTSENYYSEIWIPVQ